MRFYRLDGANLRKTVMAFHFGPKQKYVLKRLVQALPTIAGVLIFNFFLLHAAPGDLADVLAGQSQAATPEFMSEIRARYGLDKPLYIQFFQYAKNLLTLNLGYSYVYNMPVLKLLMGRLPASLLLLVSCLVVSITGGILLGTTASRNVNKPVDYICSLGALFFYSTPVFWTGLLLIIVFSIHLGWLPSSGFETIGAGYTGLARALDIGRHLILPTATYASFYLAVYTRIMRASMLEVYNLDFIRTAVAKGLSPRRIAFKHVLRNSLLPIVTMVGMQCASLLGGVVIIESVFGWPGVGRLIFEAVGNRDFNLVLSILTVSSVLVIVVNLFVDFIYAWLDPRIELR
jgi:peptide/nickel transport system permease protein